MAGSVREQGRDAVYGPGLVSGNASLHKIFTITERVNFDFSANATNALNHLSLSCLTDGSDRDTSARSQVPA